MPIVRRISSISPTVHCIAKQVGNVRDVGAAASWTFGAQAPVTLEGGTLQWFWPDQSEKFLDLKL